MESPVNDSEFENPVLGYLVIASALILGLMTASVLGSSPPTAKPAADPAQVSAGASALSPPAAPRKPRRWVLGVRVKPTFTGCVVHEVLPRSAASGAGVVAGDRILCLGGRQVGWVDSHRVALDRVVDDSPTSATRLLVQKASTGRVMTIAVRLQTLKETLGHQ